MAGREPTGALRPQRVCSHDFVADQLRRQIALRLFAPGGALPTQRELARIFGVGRSTADRAVKVLESEGLVVSTRGRNGGRFVTGPRDVPERLAVLLAEVRRSRDTIEQALVFRRALEPAVAAHAAAVRSLHDLRGIRAAASEADRARGDEELARLDSVFHLAIAAAAHNDLMVAAIETVRVQLTPVLLALPDVDSWHARTSSEHAAIVGAIGRRDVEASQRAMAIHVRHTELSVLALLGALPS